MRKKKPLYNVIAINHCCVFQCCDPNWYHISNGPTGYATGFGSWCKRKSRTRWHCLRLGCEVSKGLLVIVYKSLLLFYYFCHLNNHTEMHFEQIFTDPFLTLQEYLLVWHCPRKYQGRYWKRNLRQDDSVINRKKAQTHITSCQPGSRVRTFNLSFHRGY